VICFLQEGNAMYQVGQEVIGYWGAMHPYSYGQISEWNPEQSMKFVVQWDDGSEFHGRCSDIYHGNVGCSGIGVYFAQNEEAA